MASRNATDDEEATALRLPLQRMKMKCQVTQIIKAILTADHGIML
jgi:hypothetical protein